MAYYLSISKRQRCVLNLRASPGPQCTSLGRDLLRTKVRAQCLPLPLARNVFPRTQEGKQWCSIHFRAQDTEPQRGLVKGQCFNSRTWSVCYYRIAGRDLARAPKRRRGIGGTRRWGARIKAGLPLSLRGGLIQHPTLPISTFWETGPHPAAHEAEPAGWSDL